MYDKFSQGTFKTYSEYETAHDHLKHYAVFRESQEYSAEWSTVKVCASRVKSSGLEPCSLLPHSLPPLKTGGTFGRNSPERKKEKNERENVRLEKSKEICPKMRNYSRTHGSS